jgi:hypothetical protein
MKSCNQDATSLKRQLRKLCPSLALLSLHQHRCYHTQLIMKARQNMVAIGAALAVALAVVAVHVLMDVRAAVLAHARVVAKDHVRKPAVVLALVVAEVVAIKI